METQCCEQQCQKDLALTKLSLGVFFASKCERCSNGKAPELQ